MGSKINSKYSEYNIVYSGDEKTMVFSRYEKRRDVIFISYKENGVWSDPVEITEQIGSQGDMYATALSYDGKELFLVLITPYDADFYVSYFENGEWSYAKTMGRAINSKYFESNASISADGTTFYFSSDRASSIGGFDIYYSIRTEGKWSKAENLGETINTKSNEESPFITESGRTLYFSSDRAGSIGRMDIYYSKLENQSWSEPVNMGMPYNTVEDDLSFRYFEKYKKGYIARDLPGGFGKLDIYMLQSGTDRQREVADYMASLKPPAVEKKVHEVIPDDTASFAEIIVEEEKKVEGNVHEDQLLKAVVTGDVVINDLDNLDSNDIQRAENQNEILEAKTVDETDVFGKTEIKEVVTQEKVTSELSFVDGIFTVQVLALKHPEYKSSFQGLNAGKVQAIEGDDGFTRYIYGVYNSHKDAINALKTAFASGYDDAFIRKIAEINNVQ
jgi:hypothetical protein